MFVRVCRSLQDIGVMVPVGEVANHVTPDEPYFRSLYDYTQEGKDYFDTNGRIKGFKGEVSTSSLIFDIDGIDLEESRINTIRLIDHLKTRGLYEELSSIISFSGSKGYHITVNTDHIFAPTELKKICVTLGKEIDFIGECKLDPSVYNTNRIFRIVNTVNEKSGLYKVDLTESDLRERTTEEILEYAKTPKQSFEFESKIPKVVIENALESVKTAKRTSKQSKFHITPRINRNIEEYGCYLAIQNGEVGHGESNTAFLRLAQFYKDSGATRQQTREKLVLAAHNRTLKHPSTNEISDEKLDYEILGCIYSGEGYTFTHTDEFLTDKCRGKCLLHGKKVRKPVEFKEHEIDTKALRGFGFNARMSTLKDKPVDMNKRGFKSLKQSAESFDKFCDEMDTTRVYTGIAELDDKVMIVPSGIVVINARPSVGKSSIMLNMMDNICRNNKSGISALIYSADMSEDEFYAKMMTRVLKISTSEAYAIRKDPHYHELRKKADLEIEKAYGSAMMCYQKRLTVDQVREDLTSLRDEGRLPKAVFIDYVQKLIGCEDYNTGVQNLMELKAIQDEFKTNLILLSQIPRQGGNEETPVRTSGAAKGGSIYEETASIVLNMWRPMRHSPDTSADNVLTIYIAKNRMGAGDSDINLHFNGAHSEIRSMKPEEYEEFKINISAYDELKQEQNSYKRAKFR